MTVKRTSQVVTETVSNVTPKTRMSQVATETVSSQTVKLRLSQLVLEVISPSEGAVKPHVWIT